MKTYYATKISENLSRTDEGYLVCQNVRIARTGIQEYLPSELEVDGDEMIPVYRTADEVFSPAAMASFEGKPLTDDHPQFWADSENVTTLMKGVVQNIRRDGEYLVADLIVYEDYLINEIMNGKRELSCGYDSKIELDADGKYYQRNIRGNHVAVVEHGRAGDEVKILDQDIKQPKKGGRKFMSKKKATMKERLANILRVADSEASPEEIAEAIESVVDSDAENKEPVTDEGTPENQGGLLELVQAIADQVQTLTDQVAALSSGTTDEDPEMALLEAIENELSDEDGGESEVMEPADSESFDEEPLSDDDPVEDDDPVKDEAAVGSDNSNLVVVSDRAAILSAIRTLKPIVAKTKDKKTRKAMADSISKIYRAVEGKPQQSGKNGYAALIKNRAKIGDERRKMADSDKRKVEAAQKGYDARNPHKK